MKLVWLVLFLFWICIWQQEVQAVSQQGVSTAEPRRLRADGKPCVHWGNTFDVPLNSKNLLRPCSLPDGRPICCAALNNFAKNDSFAKPIGRNFHPPASTADIDEAPIRREKCVIHKVYVSSPQELRDLEKAKQISTLSADHTAPERLQSLVDYVFSEEMVRNATRWLDRVHDHMTAEEIDDQARHPDDMEFLSRFEFTRTCGNGVVDRWVEWIEPVNIAARHPFGMGGCRPVRPMLSPSTPVTGRSNVDYVLLQSGKGLFDQTYYKDGRRMISANMPSETLSAAQLRRHRYTPINHFMLDAGTSTFDSSLYWFTCAFSQVSSVFSRRLWSCL
jgi:hypothetical protein